MVNPDSPAAPNYNIADAEEFWDKNLAPTQSISIQAHESYAAGNESAHVLTLTTTVSTDGKTMTGIGSDGSAQIFKKQYRGAYLRPRRRGAKSNATFGRSDR